VRASGLRVTALLHALTHRSVAGESLTLFGDASVRYEQIETEILNVAGVVSIALMQDKVDVLVIRTASGQPTVLTKEELLKSLDSLA